MPARLCRRGRRVRVMQGRETIRRGLERTGRGGARDPARTILDNCHRSFSRAAATRSEGQLAASRAGHRSDATRR